MFRMHRRTLTQRLHIHIQKMSQLSRTTPHNGNVLPSQKTTHETKTTHTGGEKKDEAEAPYKRALEKTIAKTQHTADPTNFKALLFLMDAHMHNVIEPGTYNQRLNDTLKLNNIEPINLPPIQSSQQLLKKLAESNNITTYVNNEQQTSTAQPSTSTANPSTSQPQQTTTTREARSIDMDTDAEDFHDRDPKLVQYTTEQLNIKAFANKEYVKSVGYISAKNCKTAYYNGYMKFILSEDCNKDPDTILRYIHTERLAIHQNDLKIVEPVVLRKIQNMTKHSPDRKENKKHRSQ